MKIFCKFCKDEIVEQEGDYFVQLQYHQACAESALEYFTAPPRTHEIINNIQTNEEDLLRARQELFQSNIFETIIEDLQEPQRNYVFFFVKWIVFSVGFLYLLAVILNLP